MIENAPSVRGYLRAADVIQQFGYQQSKEEGATIQKRKA